MKKIFFYIILAFAFFIFSETIPAIAAQAVSYVPPLNESDMQRYAKFCQKKNDEFSKAAALKNYSQLSNSAPSFSFTESMPYEKMKPVIGIQNVVILLVDFDDSPYSKIAAKYRSPEYYKDMVVNPDTRSLNRYFKEVSEGLLDVKGVIVKAGPGEGADKYWYRSQKPYMDWGRDMLAYDSVDSPNIAELASEVIKNSSSYFDYSKYDSDGNGIISPDELHIVIFHSGSGQEKSGNSNDIWSHRFNLVNSLRVNNVMVDSYIMLSCDSPVGVICHEFCHDLGLFDVYDTDTGRSVLGSYSIMDRGAWCGDLVPGSAPSYPCAYERMLLGWLKLETISNDYKKVCFWPASMPAAAAYNYVPGSDEIYAKAVKYIVPGNSGSEFLVMENRYKTPRSFDEALPPAFKSENGILVYHVDETMPDKTFYGYANDSRNSRYRICIVKSENSDIENSYFTAEFNSENSGLLNFYNGTANSLRMNINMQDDGVIKSEFNLPRPELTLFEVENAAGNLTSKLKFNNINKSMTRVSISLKQDSVMVNEYSENGSGETKISSDDIWLLKNYVPQNLSENISFNIKDLEILAGGKYYLTVYLQDGKYMKTYQTDYFEINSGRQYLLKTNPSRINYGMVILDLMLSDAAAELKNTAEIFLQYTDNNGGLVEKMADCQAQEVSSYYNGLAKNAHRYKYYIDGSVNSNVRVKVKVNGELVPGLEKEIFVDRVVPTVNYGVYSSLLIPDSLLFVLESDKKLYQAQFYIKEEGYDTKAVAVMRRDDSGSEVYYGRYKIMGQNSGKINYYVYCVDTAGNSYVSKSINGAIGNEIYKLDFNFLRSPSLGTDLTRYEFDGNIIEFSNKSGPTATEKNAGSVLKSATAALNYGFLKVEKNFGKYKITFMPEDAGEISEVIGAGVEMKVAGSKISCLINDKTGAECLKNSDGSFKISRFGTYSSADKAAAVSLNENFYPVPNPAKNSVAFYSPRRSQPPAVKFKLKIVDSSNARVYENDFYSGEKINLSDFSNGTYFYIIKNDDGNSEFSYKGKFSVLK